MQDDMESILTSIKKTIGGLYEQDETFDADIIMFINSELSVLNQLGIGPENGFSIVDKSSKWSELLDDVRLNAVKELITIKVRLVFDTSLPSGYKDVLQSRAAELEWRMNVMAEQLEE